MSKQKIVISLCVSNGSKKRSKAMQMASKFGGVNSVRITGDSKDRLEVVGEEVNIPCLVHCLRRKVCYADIVEVEEVKDKKEEEEKKKKEKEEEEKKKKEKEEEEKKKKAEGELLKPCCPCPQPCLQPCRCSGYGYHPLPFYGYCEEPAAASCHIM